MIPIDWVSFADDKTIIEQIKNPKSENPRSINKAERWFNSNSLNLNEAKKSRILNPKILDL